MPNTREKLIELVSQVQYLGGLEEKIADHLIANGVTIATDNNKWIPVTERLPERYQNVLTVREDRKIRFDAIGSLDVWYEERWHTGNPVTHWMPLPEPPKGEEQ